MVKVRVLRGDSLFQAQFSEPAFRALKDVPAVAESVFKRLTRYGLQLTDIKIEQPPDGSLGAARLTWPMFNFLVTVSVRLEHVEVQCYDTARVASPDLTAATLDVLQGVGAFLATPPFSTYSLALGIHGVIEDGKAATLLSRFVGAHRNLLVLLSGPASYSISAHPSSNFSRR